MQRDDDDEGERDFAPVKLPALGDTPEKIQKFLAALAVAVKNGRVGVKRGQLLASLPPKALNCWKADREAKDLPEMEAKLEELKRLRTEMEQRAEQIRQGRIPH